ncbi:hypothetical protein ABES02_09190 [Neobacillus pocheonensis]|uniref:hypothetical protein n=1 Tax=Neobacillus pocheonensis TaxID=363869 RepID=UPI003D28ACAD
MADYFFNLFMYLFFIIVIPVSICFFHEKEKKRGKSKYIKTPQNRKSYQIFLKEKFGILVGIFVFLFSSISFIYLVQDLPDALSEHTKIYQGKCEIDIETGRGGGSLEANFRNHNITFGNNPYYKAHKGNYYCKVKYLPHSESGISLILYKSRGGKEVETN